MDEKYIEKFEVNIWFNRIGFVVYLIAAVPAAYMSGVPRLVVSLAIVMVGVCLQRK